MEIISALNLLKLHEIPEAWVDAVWDLEFTERKPLDDTVEEELTACGDKAFKILHQCLWTDQQQSAGSGGAALSIWESLVKNRVSVKSLVAVLSYFVLTGKSRVANVQQRVSSLHAASFYVQLLAIPGSIAHNVFHEVLLDTCSDLISHCWPQDCGKKRKKDGLKTNQAEGKRSKPQWKDTTDVDECEEEEEGEELHFFSADLIKIRDAVFLLVQSFLRLLLTFPLKDRPQSASNCIQMFSKLLYFEPVIGELNFAAVQDITKLRSVPEMAFHGLQLLCSPEHGNQTEILRSVFHHLLYVILMMKNFSKGKPSLLVLSQAILSTRDQAIHFVCYLVNKLKGLALPFLHILLQHICFQMVEKSEFRSHGAQAVGMLLSETTNSDYACFVKWLFSLSRHSKMVCRLFTVDVVMVLLEQPERRPEECQDPALTCFLPHKFLIQNLLFPRQMDKSPTVQGHALSCLAQCLELPSLNVTQAVHNLFPNTGTQTVFEGVTTEGSLTSQKSQKTYRTLPFRTVEISSSDSSSCDAKENMALLLQHVQDSNTNVRKSALQALLSLLKHGVISMSWENLALLSERCRDPAVSVKKKALQCVGELLFAKPRCSVVQKAWLQGVLPAVLDSEDSVQNKALGTLDHVILSQIKPYSPTCHMDTSQRLSWDLLGLLCHDCLNLGRFLSRAFTFWSKQNKITPVFITNLISHTKADHASGAWLLLSKALASSPTLPLGKILDAWDSMASIKDANVTSCCHILSVMGDIAVHLNEDTKDRIINDLMSWLTSFNMSLEVISAAVETLYQLGRSEDIKQTQAFMNLHGSELLTACEAYLASIILNPQSSVGAQDLKEEEMVKYLHTLGVVSLHCPAMVNKRTVLLVESVLTTNSDKIEGCRDRVEELPASLPLSQFIANSLPTRVRAHAVITLGKLCLQHEELAQKYLPVFARELEVGPEVAVRNNIVVIMCDLCVRYTTTVDRYIPNISACLRDSEAVVREQTLIMLTNLLQEEFVKWKGSLFFHFIVALVDPVPAIARLCEYCLLHLLLKKNPDIFSQYFIECIFHFNSYSKHKSYNRFPQNESEKVRFSLKGAENLEKRFQIYCFLLEHFTDAQRFNITIKINQTILACFADEELPLDADGAEILSETFNILSLNEIKLQAISTPAVEEAEEEKMHTMAKAVLQAAQNKVVSKVQKKAFVENAVPLIISLKNLLEQKRSPVLRDLMVYLQVTMQDYPNEVKEIFSGDEQLAAEVEFALKVAEKEREVEEKMKNFILTEKAATPTAQGSVQSFLIRSRPSLPVRFAAPQPAHPNRLSLRVSHHDRSKQDEHVQSNSIALELTVMPKRGFINRAISTPKGGGVNLTFDEGVSAIFSDQGTSLVEETSMQSNEQHLTSFNNRTFRTVMDHGARETPGPGKRRPTPSAGTLIGAQGKEANSGQTPKNKITPFHSSPIVSGDRALSSKHIGAASGKLLAPSGSFFLDTPGCLTYPVRERPSAAPAAGRPKEQTSSSSSAQTTGERRKVTSSPHQVRNTVPGSIKEPKIYTELLHSHRGTDKRTVSISTKPPPAVKKKKRKMGIYNLVPRKKAKALKLQEKKEEPGASVRNQAAADEKAATAPDTLTVSKEMFRNESLAEAVPREGSHVEYTELTLDCLDLKAQEELFSPSLSGVAANSEATETDLVAELPLCCCRMETPHCSGNMATMDQTCMAMESVDGMLSCCQRRVMKQELMRPSNTVHLLVLCEDHRAGMVKHQCCPGCGLFCRAGTFMECRPYGTISHRFHHDCASILRDCRFCPHCGEDASRAKQVTLPVADQSPSVTRSNPRWLIPAVPPVATLPSVTTTPVTVPQILKAKKTSEPHRGRDGSPRRSQSEAESAAERPKESLEGILMALDDENMKPKKVKYPTRQLYISAKRGELQKVIHLLVDGKDPNFLMEGQNKHTPLHAAAAEGHQEICHMLVQAGANLDMFDEEQKTPLMVACENNNLDTVKYLLRAGATINHKDIMGFTCLHLAAKLGHYDMVNHLLSKASKHINCQDGGGWTPITWAIEYKHKELVQLLLARGADVNIRDKEENVCLHWAALSGCDDVAHALLEAQCDLNAVNVHGDTPLHIAARENHLECVMLFLSRGADITQRNKEGETALDCCVDGSHVWTALNTNKKLTEARRVRDCHGERVLSRDISRGYEAVPIACVNGVDSEPCPENFKYIPDNCVTSPLDIDKDITHLQHCSCTDNCSSSTCMCGQLSLRCWYDSDGRLPLDFCQREPPVLFECNHACSCWRTCRNRVVQNGLRVRLQLFRTQTMGWGVRAMQDIPQGTFICEYIGEIISDAEADKRENDSFLFTLDNKVGDTHCIDARLFGNIGRFFNHLCEPNLLAVRVFTMHQDLRFPRIAFFSSMSIKAGDQIGFDYGDHYWRVKSKYFNCQCGSQKCRHPAAYRHKLTGDH